MSERFSKEGVAHVRFKHEATDEVCLEVIRDNAPEHSEDECARAGGACAIPRYLDSL